MSEKTYLDKQTLMHLLAKLEERYAPISALVFKGTVADIDHLPPLADQKTGWMYNVTTGGEITADFIEGSDHVLRDGDNVAAINVGTTSDPVYKWDIIPGVFKIEDRLQFGKSMPENPEDEQVFLYLGDTSYTYPAVTPAPTPDSDPATLGLFEKDAVEDVYTGSEDSHVVEGKTYYTITADSTTPPTLDPADEGYYELDSSGTTPVYTKTADTTIDGSKTYYTLTVEEATVVRGDNPQALGYYVSDGGDPASYALTTDTYVKSGVTYLTREEQYVKGVIYIYNETATAWEPQTAGDTFIRITEAEIDEMFDAL